MINLIQTFILNLLEVLNKMPSFNRRWPVACLHSQVLSKNKYVRFRKSHLLYRSEHVHLINHGYFSIHENTMEK